MLRIPLKEIEKIINYIYEDEERHYNRIAVEKVRKKHIFVSIKKVSEWLKGINNVYYDIKTS